MRWIVPMAWVLASLVATAVLGGVGAAAPVSPTSGPLVDVPRGAGAIPEGLHLLGHLLLCGGCAVAFAWASKGAAWRRATWGIAGAMALGAAIEFVQVGLHPTAEVVHDLALDATGAGLGVLVWGMRAPGRAHAVGHVLSWVFHPAWLAPLGLFGLAFAAVRDVGVATRFAISAMLCLGPAVALWLLGWWRGWWSDPDLSTRRERPAVFAVGLAGVLAWTAWVWSDAAGLPLVLRQLAVVGLGAAVLGVVTTVAGLKVSGHVAIPATIAFGMLAFSARGPLLLLGPALLLSWARVVANRHRRREVLAAWGLAVVIGVIGLALANTDRRPRQPTGGAVPAANADVNGL